MRDANDSVGAGVYRGADRRSRTATATRTIRRSHVLALLAAILAGGALLPLALATMTRADALHAVGGLRVIWSLLFLTGGVLQMVRWRVTGDTRSGLRGGGAVALGALTAPTTAIGPLLSGSAMTVALTPVSRTVAVVACLSLLTRAAASPAIDTSARPVRAVAVTLTASWAFIAAMLVLSARHQSLDATGSIWFLVELGLTAGWLLCAASAGRQAARQRSATFTWMTTACVLMGCAEAARALAFATNPSWQYVATGLQLVTASLVLLNAATDLTTLLSAESRLVQMLSGAVRDTEQQLNADEQAESLRRHDARAVLAALRASSLVLDRYDETLDRETRAELLTSFAGELSRLEQMIDRRSTGALETFTVDSVVGPAARSVPNAIVEGELPSFCVQGRAIELRGLVENVLATLGRQAPPDSSPTLRVTRSTSGVQVVCEAKRGAAQADEGDDACVRNLRLQIARRMMREQGGDVVVNDGWGPTISVALWLRQAPEAAQNAQPPEPVRDLPARPSARGAMPLGRVS